MASSPGIPEHGLTPQGRIYSRASHSGESIADIAPDFKGSGATPQEKADETKAWISKEQRNVAVDGGGDDVAAGPKPDVYAQELNNNLGPVKSVMDSVEDRLHAAKDGFYGTGQSGGSVTGTAGDTPTSSATSTLSQYTQAAWDKVNELKPTLGLAKEEPDTNNGFGEAAKHQAAELVEKGQRDSKATAETAKEKTSDVAKETSDVAKETSDVAKEKTSDVGEKLLAAGGDDVLTVLSDGGASQPDASKANLRAATEMLS